MSEMLISVPPSLGVASAATTIPVRGRREIVTKLCRVALVALPVLLSGAAAMASEDEKTFPGAMCQPQVSADAVLRNDDGRMVNASGSTRTWICPVVRDVMAADGVEFAKIIVIGPTASCFFRSMTEIGGTVARVPPNSIIPLPGNLRRLQYALGDQNIPNAVGGYYHFECRIPANSGVVMYDVDENDGEG